MNCLKCGNALPANAFFCPVCNEPVPRPVYPYPPQGGQAQGMPPQGPYASTTPSGRYQPVPQGGQGVQAQGMPPQGPYASTTPSGRYQPVPQGGQGMPPQGMPLQPAQPVQPPYPPAAPQGYAPPRQLYPYGVTGAPARGSGPLDAALRLPKAFVDCFRDPADVLRRQMEGKDVVSGLIVTALALLLAFFCGMAVTSGAARSLGMPLSGLAAGAGGVAALCQLLGMLLPAAVVLVYLCAVCKARFSWELASGFVCVTTMPTVAVGVAVLLLSLVSPWLTPVAMLCGAVVSYAQMGELMAFVTGRSPRQLFTAKLVCFCVSLLATLLFIWLCGGPLASAILRRALAAALA